MDQATIMRVLERQGAENTPDNINRIIQAAASDPSIIERYSMGTAPAQISSGPGRQDIRGGGGLDDNAALLNLVQKAAPAPAPAPAPVQASAPPPPAPAQRAAPAPRRAGIPGDYNAPTGPGNTTPPAAADGGIPDWLKYLLVPGFRGKPTAPELPPPFVPGRERAPGSMDAPRITQQPPEAIYAGRIPRGDLDVIRPNTPPVQADRTGGMPETTPGMTPNDALAEANARRMNQAGGQLTGPRAVPPTQPQVEAPPARPGITGGNPPTYPGGAPQMDTRGGIDLENQRIQDEIDMKEQIRQRAAAENAGKKPSVVRPGKRLPK